MRAPGPRRSLDGRAQAPRPARLAAAHAATAARGVEESPVAPAPAPPPAAGAVVRLLPSKTYRERIRYQRLDDKNTEVLRHHTRSRSSDGIRADQARRLSKRRRAPAAADTLTLTSRALAFERRGVGARRR